MMDGDIYHLTDLIYLASAQIEDEHTIVVKHPSIERLFIHASESKRREVIPQFAYIAK
jgi:hypothetical protein